MLNGKVRYLKLNYAVMKSYTIVIYVTCAPNIGILHQICLTVLPLDEKTIVDFIYCNL